MEGRVEEGLGRKGMWGTDYGRKQEEEHDEKE